MDESPEPPGIQRTGRNWLDMMLALSAIFVSMCSLYLAHNSSNAMERLVHASSWPFIQLESGNTDDDRQTPLLTFIVSNAGTGPARIHAFEFLVDGRLIEQPDIVIKLLQACCDDAYNAEITEGQNPYEVIGTVYTRPVAPALIASDNQVIALAWPRTEMNARLWRALDEARQQGRITTRGCYCSVFDECWRVESGRLPVQQANACEPVSEVGTR